MSADLTGGDLGLLRRLNTRTVLSVLRRSGSPMTLSQLSQAAALSRQTVDAITAELCDSGWVAELAPEKALGRPARRFRFRAERGHVLGIDLGVHSNYLLLADLDGATVGSRRLEVAPNLGKDERLHELRVAVAAFVEEFPVHLEVLCAGVPGIIHEGDVRLSVPIPEWSGLHLADAMRGWFDCPVFVENDANCAAVAEHWRGAAKATGTFIHLISGYRSGAGLMLDGRLYRGRGGAAGEIGALSLVGWEGPEMAELQAAPDVEKLFADAAAGDVRALKTIDRFAMRLSQGAAAMVLTVNPDLLVIGGGMSLAGEQLLGPVRGHLARMCLDPPDVVVSTLGMEAVALGAVCLALEQVDALLFQAPAAGG
ncbi:ROK family protein [Kitasatospora sp. NPDC057015]|uniref:ROK family protein n=1 Tax=Kitasatospora sp. NPDC057015 TaxID=3346001 RepID=UPI003632F3AE